MESAMVVSSSEKGAALITELLRAQSFSDMEQIDSGSKARRVLQETDPALVVISAPLRDEFGHELALMAAEETGAGILLLVKAELAEDIEERVEDSGVLVISKPISREIFFQGVKMALSVRNRILGLKTENIRLQKKIEEIRLVDRAKCCLIQCLNMSEPQAHRYIEKRAMDERISRRAVAEYVLRTYEVR